MCRAREIPVMPGCFSPTEILEAWDAGASIVKVFPATSLGPAFIRDVRGPLPHIKLMPTGGVTVENAADWIRAGAVSVGVGSALTDAAAVDARDYAGIAAKARRLVDAVREAKGAR
jgi:2-dehydro-3-deoxyphosphogluconate aldolase/(4S)-4-hydroxy-2-oxoglutarate aldolase